MHEMIVLTDTLLERMLADLNLSFSGNMYVFVDRGRYSPITSCLLLFDVGEPPPYVASFLLCPRVISRLRAK